MLKLKWFSMLSLSTSHLSDPLRFWTDHENIYDKPSLVAEGISAPASQAYMYVESLFGLWHAHHWSQK